jgi:tripartite-type tricarboxylate transporter receptor subunit TctC
MRRFGYQRRRNVMLRFAVCVVSVFALLLGVLGTGSVYAQAYPTKTVRIVTAGVGGGNDFVARRVAEGLAGLLGQQVVVDNRASGNMNREVVHQAAPDGYTILVSSGSLWLAPFLEATGALTSKDFLPITTLARAPLVLVVHPSLPIKSVKELIAYAKAHPGELNYTTGSTGSSSHLAPELFKSMTGVDMVRIPYKSGSQEITDLLGGHVKLTFGTAASVMTHVKSGGLRALAVTSAKPSVLIPGLPAIADDLPGYELQSMYALFAPLKTPQAIIKRLDQETVRFLKTDVAKERMMSTGLEPFGSSPEELAAIIKAEQDRLGKVIIAAGIKP